MEIKTIIGSVVLGISLITGVFTIDSRYATSADLKKTEATIVKTLEQFQINQERKNLEQRYVNITDRVYDYKALIKKNPNDAELKEDYQNLLKEKEAIKSKLEK
jgi:hypothetical protein